MKYVVGTDGMYITSYWIYSINGANTLSYDVGNITNALVFSDEVTAKMVANMFRMTLYVHSIN